LPNSEPSLRSGQPDGHYVGGALVATADGKIGAEQPIEREGILFVEL
jgi:hypothetical protein